MGTPQGITLNETAHPFTFVVSEDSDGAGLLSRDEVVIATGQNFGAGQVLSRQAVPAQVTEVAAAGTNVGTGSLVFANPGVDTTVANGVHKVVFNNATQFIVEGPLGGIVGEGTVGVAFAKGLLFTATAGGTAFAEGDTFTVEVNVIPEVGEQYVAWTGACPAAAIAGYPANTTNGVAGKITVVNAHAAIRAADLTWASGATAAQIAQGQFELGKNLIKFR